MEVYSGYCVDCVEPWDREEAGQRPHKVGDESTCDCDSGRTQGGTRS